MRFTVKYTTLDGDVLVKEYEGTSPESVSLQVKSEGHYPLQIQAASRAASRARAVKTESLIIFNQELLALLRAGIPLLQSLELLVGHGKDPLLRRALEQVVEKVKEGRSFSESLEEVGSFPSVYRANVVAGERSGTLPEVLNRWLAFQGFAQKSRRRIFEALVYPMFLVLVLSVALAIIFNVVLPRFAEVYTDGGFPMPAPTRLLLEMGALARKTVWIQATLLILLSGAFRWMASRKSGIRLAERVMLALPKAGALYRMYHSSVFARTLSVLLAGGMPLLQALEVILRTIPSERMKSRLISVIEMVRSGSSLHSALSQSQMLDPLAVEMARVGEQSSALPELSLIHISEPTRPY